jgi:hypothetical protein
MEGARGAGAPVDPSPAGAAAPAAADPAPPGLSLLDLLGAGAADAVLPLLEARDLATLARASAACRAAADGAEAAWRAAAARAFPAADAATRAALRARADGGKEMYRLLAARHECARCGAAFVDGHNGAASCRFHTGVLFGGGMLNGAGLRFTCCGSRAHHISMGAPDSNGCRGEHHVSASGPRASAWATRAAAAAPRSAAAVAALGPRGSFARDAAVPWHPHRREGILELPSRLLTAAAAAP